MRAYELIDCVKVKKNLSSDYAVAKQLGMTQSAISVLRSRGSTLSDDAILSVSNLLDVDPLIILVDQVFERSKNEHSKLAWSNVLDALKHKKLCQVLPSFVINDTH